MPNYAGIAILLLDVENLQLNTETEKFLTTVCTYPIQVKIAFANWRSMGKLDVELHGRGYDLIHVPSGRDNADGKMIAFGSSVHERYPNVKEVLVCSSDEVMTNLCNHVQQNGLRAYRVSKQGSNIKVLNISTAKESSYSLVKIPPVTEFIEQLKNIILQEESRTSNQWVTLNKIAEIFHLEYKLGVNKVVSQHFPGKTLKDVFMENSEFVLHQPKDDNHVYISVFKIPVNSNIIDNNTNNKNSVKQQILVSINSSQDLEAALINIVSKLTNKSQESSVRLEILGAEINKHYGEGITKILKRLKVNGNFIKFLQSSHTFKLHKQGKFYFVAVS